VKRLTVIVLNWNGLTDTRALLPTLQGCRLPAEWALHVMVVDNGSTDGSVATLTREFPWAEVLALGENRRFAGGNNAGLERSLAAGADAVMLLNNDTECDPGLLEHLLGALERDPAAGAAAPLIFFGPPSDVVWYAGASCEPRLGLAHHRGLRVRDDGRWRAVEETGYLTGCCLLARRACWEQVGPLDERYFIYAEDADWSLRASARGWKLLFVPGGRLWHKVSASSGAQSPFKIYHRLRANLRLWSTHARGLARLTWAPAFLAQQAALFVWLVVRGQSAAAMAVPRALLDAMAGKDPAEARP
jgi:hypothetical protein